MSLFRGILGASLALGAAHVGLTLWASRLRSRANPYPLDALSREPEGEETFIERPDGTRIRAVHRGDGPTVVLAHGYGMSIAEWSLVWDRLLAAGARVIAFDQRGHGRSTIGADGVGSRQMAGDYRAVLEHFNVRDGVLMAHSMGGFIAMVFLINEADCADGRLRGAVLVATTAGDVSRGAPQTRLQIPLIQSGLMTRIMRSKTYGYLFGASLMGDEPFPSAIEAFNHIFLQQRHERLVPALSAMNDEDHYPRLKEIGVPCVVVCGESDNTTPSWHSRRMGEEIPRARNMWLPGKGHMLNWEAPDAIVQAVRSLQA